MSTTTSTETDRRYLGSYPAPAEVAYPGLTPRLIGGIFLPEMRRSENVVTRASQGHLSVELAPLSSVDGVSHNVIADSTVTLRHESPGHEDDDERRAVRLTAGEARSLARLLTRAADEIDFDELLPE